MAEKKSEGKTPFLVYAGPTFLIPEDGISLSFGKTYEKVPKLPKDLEFLKSFFLPIKDYPPKKAEMKAKHREAMSRIADYVRKRRGGK